MAAKNQLQKKTSLNNQYQVNISGITADLQRYLSQNYDLPRNYSTGTGIFYVIPVTGSLQQKQFDIVRSQSAWLQLS